MVCDMVGWESIPFFYKIYSYLKKYVDLNERENELVAKEEKLKKEEQELNKLRTIGNENSQNYQSMIDFYPSNLYVDALDSTGSPYLGFQFNITNRTIFDFETKQFIMKVHSYNSEIGLIEISRKIDLPHQQIVNTDFKVSLHPNFINKLKLVKKEGKPLQFQLRNIKIDFTGDKEFYRRGDFDLEIPNDKINAS